MDSIILLVDIQSFYASVEKAHDPTLQHLPVAVSGDPQRRSGIILAACPIAKSYGIQTTDTLWEAKKKCPELVVVRPRMQVYLDTSIQLTQILERFSDQVEPYSIDEQFIDIKGSEKLFGPPQTIAKKIQETIRNELRLHARIGMGPNKVLAKMACDNFAKKLENGIFWLTHHNMKQYLWPLPIERMFGVGRRMSRHLRQMGIRTIGELATFPVERLKKRWGIHGNVLWMTANGIDLSPVSRTTFYQQKSIGHHITLPRDYRTADEIRVVLLELSEEVCRRARTQHLMGQTIHVSCRGANFDIPTGFHRQSTLPYPTNQTMFAFQHAWDLFLRHWDEQPIRSLGIHLSKLVSDHKMQLHLFEQENKRMKIGYVMDEIKRRFGDTAILRAISLTPAGQALDRAKKIGGHYK
ncbi:DNA polymerase IV [Thermoflavimicrobium dichotomicum]|uniref:DNA polymerase IV n=1 Tax=Thermoflavimicrobium dichotomicum TaxID=46223 RepID=A0A1I3MGX8_9BACL|nr:DNA polymerase IV [Thermoflavimicrobium dichotomicum]SFI95995.1 DNA polymerase-4 [Thermoflavimicrobium dichotomicum]